MHKSVVSFGVSSSDTKGKEAIMMVLENKPRPTFNNGEAGMWSTMVLTALITLGCGYPLQINGVDFRDKVGECC